MTSTATVGHPTTTLAEKPKGRIAAPATATILGVHLRAILRTVIRTASRRSPYPDFAGVELSIESGRIRFRSHNGYSSTEITYPTKTKGSVGVIVPIDLVRRLVRGMDVDSTSIWCDRARLVVGPWSLRCIDEPMTEADFDVESAGGLNVVVDQREFARAVEYAMLAVATDEARPILTAIRIDRDRLFSADNYQLHEAPLGFHTGVQINVQGEALEMLRRATVPGSVIPLVFSDRGVVLRDVGPKYTTVVWAGTLDGKYPAVAEVIEQVHGGEWSADAELLLATLRRANAMVDGYAGVAFAPALGAVRLTGSDTDISYDLAVPADPAPRFGFTVNPRLLIRSLIGAKGRVTFVQNDALSPLGVRREDGYRAAVMPIRTTS